MSYFYDIYVSSYVDENQDTDIDQKWINNLIYFLQTLLRSRLEREPTIVSSCDFKEDGIFHGRNKNDVIGKSALFIVLINDNYLGANECLEEIDIFLQSNPDSILQGRAVKLLKQSVETGLDKIPEALNECNLYEFFIKSSFKDNIEEELLYFDAMQDIFWLKLVDLAFDLDIMLQALNTENYSFFLGKTVYLAESTDDQQENVESIKRELIRHGYKILPDKPLSKDPWKLRTEVVGYLGASTLSVHLIGNEYGELLKNSEFSAVDLQNKIAADYFTKLEKLGVNKREQPFARLIWINPDTRQIKPQQKKFIEELKNDDKLVKGADVLEIPIEILKSTIHTKTNQINKLKKEIENDELKDEQKNFKKIYFIHEKEINLNCSLLQKWLTNNEFIYEEQKWVGTQIEQIEFHQSKIIEDDYILIYYSGNNPAWLKSKVFDLVKTAGFERKTPHKGKAIYSDVDLSEFESYLGRIDILKLDQPGGIEEKLQPFIDKLNGD